VANFGISRIIKNKTPFRDPINPYHHLLMK